MAKSDLVPLNGSVVVGSLALDFASFEIEGEQSVEDATAYGTSKLGKNVGSGTPILRLRVGAFGLKGLTGANPGFDNTNNATGTFAAGGVTTTLGFDTGCTESGLAVVRNLRAQHARMRAVVPFTLELLNAGDFTETWATS